MDNWIPISLKNCGKWYSGGTPSKENSAYWDGDIPWISAKSMHDIYVSESEDMVTEVGANNGTRLIPPKTILILVRGSMLYRRIPICLTTRAVTFNQDVKAIIPAENIVPEFLLYWLMSHENVLLSKVEVTGMGAGKLSTDILENTIIPLPPLAEQKAIAQILGTWDEAIATTEALIEALTLRKRALMQRLLTGEVRFPEFDGEWSLSKLGEHAKIRRGASPRPIKDTKWFAETGRGWIRIADINASSSRFLDETTQYLSDLGVEKSVKVEVGELILSIAATIGVPKIVNIPACIHDGFVLIKEYENLDTEFLYHYLSYQTDRIARGGQPGTQKNINSEIVRLIDVPDISLDEQQRIAECLNDIDAEINQLIAVTSTLQEQKRGLMQVLLTGQVRVDVAES
jgi:type I restriction enzyme, S subunit